MYLGLQLTCLPVTAFAAKKPGGSGMLAAFLGFAGKGLLMSTTHFGGGGGRAAELDDISRFGN